MKQKIRIMRVSISRVSRGLSPSILLLLIIYIVKVSGLKDNEIQKTEDITSSSLFPSNHRQEESDLNSSATVFRDINALASFNNNNNNSSRQFPSGRGVKVNPNKRRLRPGTVTSLGEIPINDEEITTTTTEVYLVTSSPRTNRTSVPRKRAAPPPPILRQEPWVLPLLVLSTITLIAVAAFEVFVLCQARRAAPSRRHLFLGQMLLLGVFMCITLAGMQTATPTTATCAVGRLGVGLAYAIVFSALLVKSVFLISLNGGVYLPAPYQALLLLFAVLIQVAVGAQWLLNSPPSLRTEDIFVPTTPRPTPGPSSRHVITASDVTPVKVPSHLAGTGPTLCGTPYSETLAALVYVVFLMGFVGVLAAKSRGIRENYREATYIGLSVACCAPLWLGWSLAGLALAPRHQDACVGFGLLATGVVVFSLMFLPRGRQLAAMGRDGRYAEDGGEERFSSLSPSAVAGYSPSFFHFKPAPAPTLLPTKHGAPPGGGGIYSSHLMGDRVALVGPPQHMHPPPPPSYPRLMHYYPYLYYPPRYPGLYMKPDDGNMYTTLEPTLSSNPNVFFQRGGVHSGMMY